MSCTVRNSTIGCVQCRVPGRFQRRRAGRGRDDRRNHRLELLIFISSLFFVTRVKKMKFSTAALSIFFTTATVAAFTNTPVLSSSRAAFIAHQHNGLKNGLFMSSTVVEKEKQAETFE